ncbi:MAG: hypothetical protein OEY73_06280 [Hadesarchaea archaeon]|nr:hypothetical protein [Hadesarchaea archaeon]
MDLKELQENLRKFGLSKYETLVYITLLKGGTLTASEIVEASGIPHPRLYDVVSSLERKGLIESKSGRPKKSWCADPEVALPRFFGKFEKSYKTILDISKEMYRRTPTSQEKPSVWVVKGRENVLSKMTDVIKNSKVEILAAIPDLLAERWGKMFLDRSSNGVSISLVIHPFEKRIENFKEMSERISLRAREAAGMSVVAADNKRCLTCSSKMLAPEYHSEMIYGVFMEDNSGLMQIINDFFFSTLWQHSKPANEVPVRKVASFVNVCTAAEYINVLQNLGKKAKISVWGKLLKTGEIVNIKGHVETTSLEKGVFRTMHVKTSDGKLTSIGGLGATLEDVEAEKILIELS